MTKVLIGRLRRDLMLLGREGDQPEELSFEDFAKLAVKQGRAEQVFILEASSIFSASEIAWANVDGGKDTPASLPALNPESGEQESRDEPDTKLTGINEHRSNIEGLPRGPSSGRRHW